MDTSSPPALHQRLDTGLDALGLDRALAAPLLDYTRAAAAQLQSPASYVEQVRAAAPTLREP